MESPTHLDLSAAKARIESELAKAKAEVNSLDAAAPTFFAKLAIGQATDEDAAAFRRRVAESKRSVTELTLAIAGLPPMIAKAREDSRKATAETDRQANMEIYEKLKAKLDEQYDEKTLMEIRRVANNIGRSQGGGVWKDLEAFILEIDRRPENRWADIEAHWYGR